jgi:phospholipid/cholesterol/gamma-HCH transport system substrate-binding protein
MERDRPLEIKVGLFVSLGLALLLAIFIILGSEKNLFERNFLIHGSFSEISGLRQGAAVRLAGLDVGLVTAIEFPHDLQVKQVHVHMRVAEQFRQRIRGDTVAKIETQGVLGDKYISLVMGSPDRAVLEDGAWVDTEDPKELMAYLDAFPPVLENIRSITAQIDQILKGETGEKAGQSIADILFSLRNILREAEMGEGVIHQLVYDRKAGEDLKNTLHSIGSTADSVAALARDIREGDGSLHALIYDKELQQLVASLKSTAENIDGLVADVKDGPGLVHTLVYTDEGQRFVDNLSAASTDIKDMIASIKAGEGTLGALVTDPSVYQDVKSLLGGAERNKVLKAYVRDTIRRNEREEGLADGGTVPGP